MKLLDRVLPIATPGDAIMTVQKILGDPFACHPSLRSGSACQAIRVPATEILRFAQDDMIGERMTS